ncbi:DUF1868-domain-containing protein [Acephala macrosclerotiorum]|nr:DUF1868-domain-containing protein [Acephala macrosclerotiorum]
MKERLGNRQMIQPSRPFVLRPISPRNGHRSTTKMTMQKMKHKISGFFSTRAITIVLLWSLGAYLLRLNMLAGSVRSMIPVSTPQKYPSGIPEKFDLDGNVQPFPGNTIICHLSPFSEIYASMQALYEKLKEHHLSPLYTLLPPSSWHMTVFEGALDKRRKAPAYWPADLDVNASIADCTAMLEKKLESFDLQYETPFRLSAIGFKPLVSGISIQLESRTAEENIAIRRLRDRLADVTKMKQEKHDKYRFHLTVAYILRYLSDEQEKELRELVTRHFKDMPKELELGLPEFCKFEDMFAFERVFYLKNKEE